MPDTVTLSPTQATASDRLLDTVRGSHVTLLIGSAGCGKTTLVSALGAGFGRTARVSPADVIESAPTHQSAIEDTLHHRIAATLDEADLVIVEDIDLVCYTNKMSAAYPRPYYFQVALKALFEKVRTERKKLVFTATDRDQLLPVFHERSLVVELGAFKTGDYAFFLEHGLGVDGTARLDVGRAFSAAPRLSAYQLLEACALVDRCASIDTDAFVALLETRVMTSNVALGEVARVSFADLKGFDDIIDALETHITIPLQAATRFKDLGLTPKRGVLLFGPPGTGKTSVGRALAHQLKGKFFMIDGTFTTEPPGEFYNRVKRIFELAKHNTPSIIFIDDADILMQSERIYGLNRYLLSMLDGLESETAGMVTVMVTAMDPNQLPPALLRSGRIELWLETTLPDADTRLEILSAQIGTLGKAFSDYNADIVATETEGFNAADVKRLVADLKALYARDVVKNVPRRPAQAYLELAAAGIRRNKALVTAAQEGRLRLRHDISASRELPARTGTSRPTPETPDASRSR